MEFTVALPDLKNAACVCANDFGMGETLTDNTQALNLAISFCRQFESSILEIRQGIYRFDNAETINFDGMSGFCLNGNGSEFIFSDLGHLRLQNCTHVLLKGIVIDWDWENDRLASLMRVHAISDGYESVEVEFPELETVGSTIKFDNMNQYDPITLTPGTENGREFWGDQLLIEKTEKCETDNHLRIYPVQGSFANLSVGDVFLVRHLPRRGSVLIASDCEHLTLQNLTVYSSPGNCFVIAGGTHHVWLDSCIIGLRPDSGRHLSTYADGYHIAQSKGYHIVENCDFSYMGDDAVNVHDGIGFILGRIDEFHIQLENTVPGIAGDVFEIRGPDFSDTGVLLELVGVQHENHGSVLTFSDRIPQSVGETYMLRNTRFNSSHYIIRNNHFHHNRARGLLLQCSDGLVENNRFTGTQGAAIYVMMETLRNLWYEGAGVNHLIITGNVFENCNVNDWSSVIDIMAVIPDKQSDYPVFNDILIENNSFDEFPSGIVFINKSNNVQIIHNHFRSNKNRKTNKTNRGHFYVNHSRDVLISENDWEPSPCMETPGFVHADGKSDGGLYRISCDDFEKTGKLLI